MVNSDSAVNTVLAFDTSTEALSVALLCRNDVLTHFELAPRLHAQKILPLIEQILAQAQITIKQVDAFVFGRGPGAFTGVRTAVGVVQGLAYACERPVLGVSTLEALAEGAWRRYYALNNHVQSNQPFSVITALDARMSEVYWAAWQRSTTKWQCLSEERVVAPDQVQWPVRADNSYPWIICGSGFPAYRDAFIVPENFAYSIEADEPCLPDAQDMLSLALPRLRAGQGVSADQAQPVYLRDDVADKSAREKRSV